MEDQIATQREMPRYKCHKQVWALKIDKIEHLPNPDEIGRIGAASYGAIITPADDGYASFNVSAKYVTKHNPQPGGYYVVYADGYESFSPAAAFESGYSLVVPQYETKVYADGTVATGIARLPDECPAPSTHEHVNFSEPKDNCVSTFDGKHWVQTLEGPLIVSDGDWIITGIKGEHYPCKPDIFEAIYEPAE